MQYQPIDNVQSPISSSKKKLLIVILSIIGVIILTTIITVSVLVYKPKKPLPLILIRFLSSNSLIGKNIYTSNKSIDGLRPDYLDRHNSSTLPNFFNLINGGVRATYMESCFPTKTFPNHFSIVTGLYPESHGLIENTMFDPLFSASYSISDSNAVSNPRWYFAEPIWTTAQKQGLIVAPIYWVGAEVPFSGIYPNYWFFFNDSTPYGFRVNTTLSYLSLPESQRPSFLTIYMSIVDTIGHQYGPDNITEIDAALLQVDQNLGILLQGLENMEMEDKANIILTSDHGMAETSQNKVIILDNYITLNSVRIVTYSPIGCLNPINPDNTQQIFNQLNGVHPNMTAYLKGSVPENLHYNNNRRICSIILIADVGWTITNNATYNSNPARFNGGNHGYLPDTFEMRATFIAKGPSFKKGLNFTNFQNIQVYNLMTNLLNIKPNPNNGTFDVVEEMLSD